MSTIGTGIAAAVANTANQARQVNANSGGSDARRAHSAKQTDLLTLSQLHDAGAARDTDQELPDHQALGYQQLLYDQGDGDPECGDDGGGESADAQSRIARADAPDLTPLTYGPGSDTPISRSLDLRG